MTIDPVSHFFMAPEVTLPDGTVWEAHRLHYLEYRSADKKGQKAAKTLICVHGLTRNAWDFHFIANALVQAGVYDRIIALDVAGRGQSAWLKQPAHYGYPLYVSDGFALLKHLGLAQVDWLGTSMGGLIGMSIAATTPGIFGRMVINDIGAFIPSASLMRIGKYCGKLMTFPNRAELEVRLRSSLATFCITDETHWQHIFKHAALPEKEHPVLHLAYDPRIGDAFWNPRGKQRKMPDMPLWELWQKVQTPTLLLRGADSDLLLAETAEQMKQNPALKKLVTFPGVGHAPALMDDAQIRIVQEFLQS